MLNLWALPRSAVIGGKSYPIHCDYRDILEIFSYLNCPDLPDYMKWRIALALFYEGEIPPEDYQAAITYFLDFIRCGEKEEKPSPRLLDWDKDAPIILADVNKVAGQEIRALPFLHWWTFLSYFHAIGEGQLSFLISLREKLRQGKKLEAWEKEYYQKNRSRVELPRRYSLTERQQREKLLQMLDGPAEERKESNG